MSHQLLLGVGASDSSSWSSQPLGIEEVGAILQQRHPCCLYYSHHYPALMSATIRHSNIRPPSVHLCHGYDNDQAKWNTTLTVELSLKGSFWIVFIPLPPFICIQDRAYVSYNMTAERILKLSSRSKIYILTFSVSATPIVVMLLYNLVLHVPRQCLQDGQLLDTLSSSTEDMSPISSNLSFLLQKLVAVNAPKSSTNGL